MKEFWRENAARLILLALIVAYSVYFSALSIQRHNTFRTHASDLGQMDQALWNTLHGNLLEDTRPDGRRAPRLTDHVEPIFLVVPLVFLLYDGVEAILVLQSIAIAIGALPVFWIARRRLQCDGAALAFSAIYLLFPALEAANLAEFHAVTLAPAPLLLAYHYAGERAWKRFALFALVALAVKEEIALLVFVMALWAALRDRVRVQRGRLHIGRLFDAETRLPLALAALSLVWFLVALYGIVPRFSPAGRSVYVGRYTCASQALQDWTTTLPQLAACVLVPDKIGYLLQLLASAGLLALLDPVSLFLGAPSLILNLLSSYAAQYSGTYHYSAPVAPYFVLAAIGGAGAAADWLARRWPADRARTMVVLPALLIALGYHAQAGYTPFGGEFFWPDQTTHQQLFARFAQQIPPGVPVSTTSSLFPHLSHRRVLYRFPTVLDADYVLLDISQSINKNATDFRIDYLKVLEQGFGVRDALDGYILLQRGLPQKELPDGFYTFLLACPCVRPQQPVVVDFEDKLRLLGYDVLQDDWQRVYLRTYWTHLPGFDKQNYAFYPFFVDDDGAAREDLVIPPLLVHFWYGTLSWREGEVVIAETVPLEVGPRAKLALGVFFGATWEQPERRLAPHSDAPLLSDGSAVWLGELVRNGKRYAVVPPTTPPAR